MTPGELDGGMERGEGLDEHLALDIATSRPAAHLGQQLEGPLPSPEIRHVQTEVGMDDSDQGHVRKVEPLGDHLGADQDVDLAGPEVGQDPAVVVLALERVGIHPRHTRLGNNRLRTSSTRSVPRPEYRIAGFEHWGHWAGTVSSWPQM